MRTLFVIGLLLAAASPGTARQQRSTERAASQAAAQTAAAGGHVLLATVVKETPPAIDGRLDDPVWATAAVATDFTQSRPHPGERASFRTEVRVSYDAGALYVGARLYDPCPDSIVAQLTRRDQAGVSDRFEVAIDSYHDRRTAYVFALNPRGVRSDAFLLEDTLADVGWDGTWLGAAHVDSLGWTVEFRIPFSQLRFHGASGAADEPGGAGVESDTWGIDFHRVIGRSREESYWAPPPADHSRLVSAFGSLAGLRGLRSPRRIEVVPYTVAQLSLGTPAPGNPFERRARHDTGVGVDLKYGIGPSTTLTATFNPDFGQVEADPAEVNLSGFETFFPEKRPFFLEGADIFRFGLGLGSKLLTTETLFYSRRIGRPPQLTATGADFTDTAPAVPILGAAKLTAKTTGGWSVGLLDAVTGRADVAFEKDSIRGEAPVEPLTNYAVARVARTGRGGQSAVGGVFTATNRRLDAPAFRRVLAAAAYTGGIDLRHRFGRGRYELTGWVLGSRVLGSDSAIARRQRDPAHYFQRPGTTYLDYNPSRRTLDGWAASFTFGKVAGPWAWGVIENVRSPGFDVNDLGYAQSSDRIQTWPYLAWTSLRPWHRFRQIRVAADVLCGSTWGGETVGRGAQLDVRFSLLNEWSGELYAGHQWTMLRPGELRGGPALRVPANDIFLASAASDPRRRMGGNIGLFYRRYTEAGGRQLDLNAGAWLRPSGRLELSLKPFASWRNSAWQYVTAANAGGRANYVFADLEQVTTALEARLDYTFSPTLTFQLYSRPFVGTGDYAGFKEVVDPLAARLADRFRAFGPGEIQRETPEARYRVGGASGFGFADPDYGARDVRTNAVLRWEFRPGSTLFLVWSQERPGVDRDGRYDAGRELAQLLRTPARNTLLLKASYWLGT